MYTGNGVTKKFPLPEGADGSVVILKTPGGKGVRMAQGTAYSIQDNTVYFYAAPPAGIEISFDESDANEIIDSGSNSYIIIYANGKIEEVDEDPVIILSEAKKLLTEAKKCAAEITQAYDDAKSYIASVISNSGADLDGRLDGYSKLIEQNIADAALKTTEKITAEWAYTLERVNFEAKNIRETLLEIEKEKAEINQISTTAAGQTKTEIIEKCAIILESCNELKSLKTELEKISTETKQQILNTVDKAINEVQEKINYEINKLREYRTSTENYLDTLNKKITNRWGMLGGEING